MGVSMFVWSILTFCCVLEVICIKIPAGSKSSYKKDSLGYGIAPSLHLEIARIRALSNAQAYPASGQGSHARPPYPPTNAAASTQYPSWVYDVIHSASDTTSTSTSAQVDNTRVRRPKGAKLTPVATKVTSPLNDPTDARVSSEEKPGYNGFEEKYVYDSPDDYMRHHKGSQYWEPVSGVPGMEGKDEQLDLSVFDQKTNQQVLEEYVNSYGSDGPRLRRPLAKKTAMMNTQRFSSDGIDADHMGPEGKSGDYSEDVYSNVQLDLPGGEDDDEPGDEYQEYLDTGDSEDHDDANVVHEVRIIPQKGGGSGGSDKPRSFNARKSRIRQLLAARRRAKARRGARTRSRTSDRPSRASGLAQRRRLLAQLRRIREMKTQLMQRRLQQINSPSNNPPSGYGHQEPINTYTVPPPTGPPLTGVIGPFTYQQPAEQTSYYNQYSPVQTFYNPQPPVSTYTADYGSYPYVSARQGQPLAVPQAYSQASPDLVQPFYSDPLTDPSILQAAMEQAQLIANAVQGHSDSHTVPSYTSQSAYAQEPSGYGPSVYARAPAQTTRSSYTPSPRSEPPTRQSSYPGRIDIDKLYYSPKGPISSFDDSSSYPASRQRVPVDRTSRQKYRTPRPRKTKPHQPPLQIEYRTETQDEEIRKRIAEKQDEDPDYDYYSDRDDADEVSTRKNPASNNVDDDYDYGFDYDVYGALGDEPDGSTSSPIGDDIQRGTRGTGGPGPSRPPQPEPSSTQTKAADNTLETSDTNVKDQSEGNDKEIIQSEATDWQTIYGDAALQEHLKKANGL